MILTAHLRKLIDNSRTLLSDLPAHRRLDAGQVSKCRSLAAVCDLQCAVVERVRALGIRVGTAFPAFDSES